MGHDHKNKKESPDAWVENSACVSMLQIAPHPIVIVDPKSMGIVFSNIEFEKSLGYGASDVCGRSLWSMGIIGDGDSCMAIAEIVRSGKMVRNMRLDVRKHDGASLPCEIAISHDKDSGMDYAVIEFADISRHLEDEEKLRLAMEEAENANRNKSMFLASMSHEIRTPMNGIRGFLELLRMSDLTEEQLEYVRYAMISTDTLLYLINDILDFSKIESGKMRIDEVNVDFVELLKDISFLMKQQARDKNNAFTLHIAKDAPHFIKADPARLKQVLVNLIANAINFTEDGNVSLNVIVDRREGGIASIDFEVEDNGIGMNESELGRIFTAFEQAESSTSRKYGGTGLGLAIVRELAKLMNGTVTVYSEKGVGSKFVYLASFEYEDDDKRQSEERNITDWKSPAENECAPSGLKGRVLIVDDNEISRLVFKKITEVIGIESVFANNGKEAIDALAQGGIDAVIMDCHMPVMDGFEATRRIRSSEGIGGIPIIGVTANTMEGIREKCFESGMDSYLSKPVKVDELYDALRNLLGISE